MRTFKVIRGPHSSATRTQWAFEAHDLSLEECELVRTIVCDQWTGSPHWKAKQGANPFLQGYQLPFHKNDGWVLVEFWTDDRASIDSFVAYVNEVFAQENHGKA